MKEVEDMARETQKEKIARLEKSLNNAQATIQQLNNEISDMIDKADNSFENSVTYRQMVKQIEDLKLKIKVKEDNSDHNRKMYDAELKRNSKLIEEIQELKNENKALRNDNSTKIAIKKHNERGAGRKQRFTDTEIETIKMYRLQGKTIREIADMFKCSVGLVHKLINA